MRHAEPITSAAGGYHGIHRHDDRRQRLPSSRCAAAARASRCFISTAPTGSPNGPRCSIASPKTSTSSRPTIRASARPKMPDFIDDVSDLAYFYLDALAALKLTGVHVVGQSLGGWIGLEMAVRSTQRLRTLTLISAAGIHVKGSSKTDIFIIDPDGAGATVVRRRKTRQGRGRAHRGGKIQRHRRAQPHRQRALRLAAALLQSAAGALAASRRRADPHHLGRRRPRHSAGLCRRVSPADPRLGRDA